MSKRTWRNVVLVCVVLAVAVIASVDYWVKNTTKDQLYSDINAIPKNKVGLLLGTAKYRSRGIVNPYYQNRINAAVALYKAGKIDFILVSGDNRSIYYNEPECMRRDLIAQGVPENRIFLDFAGIHTLDSILRCRDIFGEDHVTIISQKFHNQRALFIANNKKVSAIAFNADDGDAYWQVTIREKLARIKMVFDLLLNKQAKKFYGDKVEIK